MADTMIHDLMGEFNNDQNNKQHNSQSWVDNFHQQSANQSYQNQSNLNNFQIQQNQNFQQCYAQELPIKNVYNSTPVIFEQANFIAQMPTL